MSSAPLASAPYKQTTQPPATIAEVPSAEPSEKLVIYLTIRLLLIIISVIIVFEDNVSKEEIDEHVAKLISAGGCDISATGKIVSLKLYFRRRQDQVRLVS